MNDRQLIVNQTKNLLSMMNNNKTKIEIDCTSHIEKKDYPISFICGKEAIEHFGIFEPEYGIIVYLMHEKEIKNKEWIPKFPKSYHIAVYCLPDDIAFNQFIKETLSNLKPIELPPFKFLKLKGTKR